jgi:flagellar biosynthetic protein FliS
MIALIDTLAGDFRRAAAALRKNDIEVRCRELNHAALVIGQLESWLDLKNGGESAETLARFYAYLRSKMIEASVTKSASLLDTQTEMILHVRSSWQQLDNPLQGLPESQVGLPTEKAGASYTSEQEAEVERTALSLTA